MLRNFLDPLDKKNLILDTCMSVIRLIAIAQKTKKYSFLRILIRIWLLPRRLNNVLATFYRFIEEIVRQDSTRFELQIIMCQHNDLGIVDFFQRNSFSPSKQS